MTSRIGRPPKVTPKRTARIKKTPEQLTLEKLKNEARKEKIRLTQLRNKSIKTEAILRKIDEKLSGEFRSTAKNSILTTDELEVVPEEIREEILDTSNIVFKANPGPQTEFLAATEKEVFFGGARGGGKSFSLIVDPLRYCVYENHNALIVRRTMPELRDLISHSHKLYPKAYPGAKWREQEKYWTFPSGARIEFGYAENEQDALRYQGKQYTGIYIDELPQYPTPDVLNLLKGSLRSVDTRIPTYIRASGNPGNIGSMWVKQMYIDPAPPGQMFSVPVDPGNPDGAKITRRFIKSTLSDNPYLTQTADYKNMLLSLPEIKRRQWLDGDWNAFDGAVFSEFDYDIHVVEPFPIPENWSKFRACDWGFSSPHCVLWISVDYDNTLWVYREMYGKGLTADIFAQKVRQLEFGEYVQYGVMDSSTWARRGDPGPAVPEIMRLNGCVWRPSDRSAGSRISGWMELHRRLRAIDGPDGLPTAKLKIFNTCKNLIRTLPLLPADPNDPEDIDTRAEDHAADALRYGAMSRPLSPEKLDFYRQLNQTERWVPANMRIGY